MHENTFNHDKIINWLFIINGICKYAEKHLKTISTSKKFTVTLDELYKDVYSTDLSNYLTHYTRYRKKIMKEYSDQGDNIGSIELEHDSIKDQSFPIKSLI